MDKLISITLIEHLNELRKRIIVCIVTLAIATIFSFPFASSILKILKLPASKMLDKLAFFSPEEAFLIYFRLAFFCALIISMPVILYQLWAFISPAIEEKFKRSAAYFVIFCSFFFIIGCLFAYFILIPPALNFLLSFARNELQPVISASKYISFVVTLIIACGFVFQMPVLSFLLTKLGIINHYLLRKKYKYATIIIVIMAAVITPTPDALNMLVLSAPMLLLYEVSIWASFFIKPKAKLAK